MRTRRKTLAALLLGLAALFGLGGGPASADHAGSPGAQATGLHISDGRLVESNGNDFVIRGVSHPHTWYPGETQSFADIKAKGANTVRVVLGSGQRWGPNSPGDVAGVVDRCKANRLICVLEVHDTTGYGEEGAAASLDQAADYWIGLQHVLAGQEDYVIVNIGNEPYGNVDASRWTADTAAAIAKLRSAGFAHTLMVDAPNWGQDWEGVMRASARSVHAADPTGNTVFSVHMYGVYDTAQEVDDYLNAFVGAGLPLVVGEFGIDHTDGNPDEDTIMATTTRLGLGYIGWSWSGNSGEVAYLDMVAGFDPDRLTEWGQRFFNGANGIRETSREATVYGGGMADGTRRPASR
ncbi:glycoside hydrolase family 5 protein [Streptomyces boncukensis]|uniref:Glycoside hydrolase family 5 protein n=1 Tax=Streptomyces boncukensis TaxID=2711219 RepID=A0A6G4WXY4_9ACTN|nr:glycoside hydrolase family 5 protein [Streptomyces boncukensis]